MEDDMELVGKETARIGMGCWAIGGPMFMGGVSVGFSGVEDAASVRTIHAALDAGVTLFDTAAAYGAGHAERLLGDALKGRDDVVIVSKLGTRIDERTKTLMENQTDPADVMPAIEACLRRLGRDHLDVMLLHLNDLSVDLARPIFEAMEEARLAGKIGGYGWSTDFGARAREMRDLPGFVAVEHAMNVMNDVPSVRDVVVDMGAVGLIRSPLGMGVFTGKYSNGDAVAVDDVRAVDNPCRDYFQGGIAAPEYVARLDAVRELLQSGGRTLAQGALCWLLAISDRCLPVPGARTPEQMEENAGALEFGPLSVEVMDEIETILKRAPEGPPRQR
jgi:aryl-alcohol dehydrogenase-like predicted oxidoreductase